MRVHTTPQLHMPHDQCPNCQSNVSVAVHFVSVVPFRVNIKPQCIPCKLIAGCDSSLAAFALQAAEYADGKGGLQATPWLSVQLPDSDHSTTLPKTGQPFNQAVCYMPCNIWSVRGQLVLERWHKKQQTDHQALIE
jgi:hypothetical protein